MAHHPTSETVEILGLNQAMNGRSCPDHDNCSSVVKPDVVVRLRKVQVIIQGKEESAITAYWVTDGIDSFMSCWLFTQALCSSLDVV